MKNIEILKSFYKEISNDKTMIFNYSKVSEFERNLFLSITTYIKNKYDYQLMGLTKIHYKRLINAIDIGNKDMELLQHALNLNSMIVTRTITMGYGGNAEKKIIKNYKLVTFIEELKKYIEEYDSRK